MTVDVPVIGSDLFPTILGIAGVKPPGDRVIDGADVLPVLTGQATTVGRKMPLYWRLNMAPAEENLQMALRDGDWKLLASHDFSHVELYNLKADPEEKRDLAAKEAERLGHAGDPGETERRDRAGRPGLVEEAQPERRWADQEAVTRIGPSKRQPSCRPTRIGSGRVGCDALEQRILGIVGSH